MAQKQSRQRSGQQPGEEQWVADFVAIETRADRVDGWAESVASQILAVNPEVAEDAVLTNTLHKAVRAHWLAFLTSLAEPPGDVRLVQPAADLAAELARRGHGSPVLFRIYRVGQQAVWQFITAEMEGGSDRPAPDAAMLMFFWGRASAWLDASIEASVGVYQAEHARIQKGAAAQRLETVRGVLAETLHDAREVSAFLGGHPLSGINTALLLHTEDNQGIADLDLAAAHLAREVGVPHPLVVNPGGRDLWCWLGTRSMPDLQRLSACRDWLLELNITVAVGTPSAGLDGFRLSHREAHEAQRIAFLSRVRQSVTLFEDVELLALISVSAEAATRFALRTLGDLGEPGEAAARLRRTLRTLLSTGSVERAAKALSVHKNTVRYRVSQAEELLGAKAVTSRAEVEVALRYYDMFVAPAETD